MRLTRLLLLHANVVLADVAFSTVAVERAFSVDTDLIQTMTGKYPVTTFVYI